MKKQTISIFLVITLLLFAFPYITFFADATEAPTGNAWNKVYFDYITQDKTDAENSDNWDSVTYELIHLNDDSIPELWITYQTSVQGCRLVTIADGAIVQKSLGSGYLSYNANHNSFIHSSGKMDVYYDTAYKLDNGAFEVIAEGRFEVTWASNGSSSTTEYYWDDISFMEQDYMQVWNTIVDIEELMLTNSDESTQYSYDDILYYLATVEVSNEVEAPATAATEEAPVETSEPDTDIPETEQTEPTETESPKSSSADSNKTTAKLWFLGGMVFCNILLIFILIKIFRK